MHLQRLVTVLRSLVLTLLLLFSAASAFAQKPVDYLVMVYLDADNDLETPMMLDLVEMTKAGYSSKVKVMILADRSSYPTNDLLLPGGKVANLKDWTTGKLLEIGPKGFIDVADWGEVDMGDPKTLSRFMLAATKRYKAKQTCLIMSNHGGGWQGGWADENSGRKDHPESDLTLFEIRDGIKGGLPKGKKLDWLGFDACLMANLETAEVLQPFAKYMVASQELEPGYGWNFTPFFQYLYKNPAAKPEAVGKVVVDEFFKFYREHKDPGTAEEADLITLSVVDLSKTAALKKSVQQLGLVLRATVEQQPEAWTVIAQSHANAQQFGFLGDDSDFALFDLKSICDHLSPVKSLQPMLPAALTEVRKSMKAFVKYTRGGKSFSSACGVTVFWPKRDFYLVEQDVPLYQEAIVSPRDDQWLSFLNVFLRAVKSDDVPPVLGDVVAERTAQGANLTATLEGEDILRALNVVARKAGDDYILLSSMPVPPPSTGQPLVAPFTGYSLVVTDGKSTAYAPVVHAEFGETSAVVYMMADVRTSAKDAWKRCLVAFRSGYGPKDQGKFLYAVDIETNSTRFLILKDGAEMRPVYPRIRSQAVEDFVVADDVKPLKFAGGKAPTLGSAQLPKGEYVAGFIVEDFSGNTAIKLIEVRR